MPKKSGSKSSRSERRAGRQRADRAREHGLPARAEPSPRARAVTPEPSDEAFGAARSSATRSGRGDKPAGIPTLVKVIGGALVILLGVYLLSRQRDEALTDTKPAAEPATASSVDARPAAPSPAAPPELTTSPEVKAAPELALEPTPQAPAPVVSVTPPTKPLVTGPVVPQPAKSKLVAPAVPAPASVPAPAAPKPPAPASAPRVDNPY
jgi:hypothetical protein